MQNPNKKQSLLLALLIGSIIITAAVIPARIYAVRPAAPLALQPAHPFAGSGQALDAAAAGNVDDDIKFEHISLEEGLSQSSVIAILQDSKGFMWFGTEDGLNKYDGYNFTVYKPLPGDPTSLTHNYILSIFEDSEGALWIGTNGGGLNKFNRDTEQFSNYRSAPEKTRILNGDFVYAIHQDSAGALWVGADNGLSAYDRDKDTFFNHSLNVSYNVIRAICEDQAGALWIGTDKGLIEYDPAKKHATPYQRDENDPRSLSHNSVRAIYQDRQGMLWVGTDEGLNRFDPSTESFTHYRYTSQDPHSLSSDAIRAIYEDREGTLWIGTYDGGLNKFNRDKENFTRYQRDLNNPHSLSANAVRSIYQDQMGALWVGTLGGGVNKFDRFTERFALYQTAPNEAEGLSGDMVRAIYEDDEGILWIGVSGGGLNRFDRSKGEWRHYRSAPNNPASLSSDAVHSIHQSRDGALWIGTGEGILDRFDPETERFAHYPLSANTPFGPGGAPILSIYEDKKGALWTSSPGGGLIQFDRDTDQLTRYPGLNDYARIILEDREGTLWVGTWSGLYKFNRDDSRFIAYRQDNDAIRPASNIILSIFEDSAGALWMGTFGGGLCQLKRATQTFACYREANGLPNNVVYGILEDDERNLWLSTNRGLSKFNPQTENFTNYDAGDGLQSNEFNAGAYFKSSSGEMFFGGINGFNSFFPEEIQDNPYAPPIVLTALTQGGEEVDTETAIESLQEVTISWPKNFFEFEFTALNYRQSKKNQYAYMLEGFDEDWIYTGARRFGRYTNLPGGTYILRVKGSNNDGVWNKAGASIKVTVTPPFWETWWFRGITLLLLAGVALGGYKLRVKNIKSHNRELETLVQARTHALEQRTRELERRRQVAEGLREILLILNSDESLTAGLNYIVSQAALLSKAEDAIVFRYGSQKQAEIVASGAQTIGPVDEWISEALLKKQPLVAPDLSAYETRGPLSASKRYKAVLGVPLSIGKEIFGGLAFFYTQKQSFSEQDIELCSTFAEQAALAIANAQLRDRAEQMAVETERSRLARDLHDAVTQTLFSASLIAEVLPKLWERNPDEGRRRSQELRELTRGALAEMRTLLLELRPSGLVEAELGDLLRQLSESIAGRARLSIAAEVSGECNLSAEVKVALYRIAQEALNNVAKHAGATQALVKLQCQAEQVTLTISDDGRGFAPGNIPPESLGLEIMRERADAINAALQIDAQPGCGTEIIVTCKTNLRICE